MNRFLFFEARKLGSMSKWTHNIGHNSWRFYLNSAGRTKVIFANLVFCYFTFGRKKTHTASSWFFCVRKCLSPYKLFEYLPRQSGRKNWWTKPFRRTKEVIHVRGSFEGFPLSGLCLVKNIAKSVCLLIKLNLRQKMSSKKPNRRRKIAYEQLQNSLIYLFRWPDRRAHTVHFFNVYFKDERRRTKKMRKQTVKIVKNFFLCDFRARKAKDVGLICICPSNFKCLMTRPCSISNWIPE